MHVYYNILDIAWVNAKFLHKETAYGNFPLKGILFQLRKTFAADYIKKSLERSSVIEGVKIHLFYL